MISRLSNKYISIGLILLLSALFAVLSGLDSSSAQATSTDPASIPGVSQPGQPVPNNPPQIISSPISTTTVGQLYTYDVDATDADGDTLLYFLTTSPSGMAIDLFSGVITWTPNESQVGDHLVELFVGDQQEQSNSRDFQSFTVTVSPSVGNQAPQITSAPATTATVGQLYTYDVDATDPDIGDDFRFSLQFPPAGAIIDPIIGLIQWTPIQAQAGDNSLTAVVTDNGGLTDTQTFVVNVKVPAPDVIGLTEANAEANSESKSAKISTMYSRIIGAKTKKSAFFAQSATSFRSSPSRTSRSCARRSLWLPASLPVR